MSSGPDEPLPDASEPGSEGRLDSWKEIAAYLRRSVRSARRWEKEEGLPVRRHVHRKGDSVYAYRSELDGWWHERGANLGNLNGAEEPALPLVDPPPPDLQPGLEQSEPVRGSTPPIPQRSRRAAWIAVGFAVAVLTIGVIAWLSRNGSGLPAGSLRPLPFQARDWVLVASFENRTGEPLFDGTLEYALTRELANSRYVNVVPRERIGDALRLMRKPPDARVDAAIGREVCLRDGEIRALLAGRVESLGSNYQLSVEIVEPKQGTTLFGFSEETPAGDGSLAAVRRISDRVRRTLGETLPAKSSDTPLVKVTTPNLRALQLYSRADSLMGAGGSQAAAEELLKQAVAEDPNFASAYIHLAHTIRNQGRPLEDYRLHAETAFRLADTTTDRERYFIRGSYYGFLGQHYEAIAAYEALLSLYPDHFWATNNLIFSYETLKQDDQVARFVARRADQRPKSFPRNSGAALRLAQVEPDLTRTKLYVRRGRELASAEAVRDFPEFAAWLELFPANERWLQGDAAGALAIATGFAEEPSSAPFWKHDAAVVQLGNLFLTLGRLRTAEEIFRRLSDPTYELAGLSLVRGNDLELKRLSSALVEHSYVVATGIGILLARSGRLDRAERVLAENKKPEAFRPGTREAASGELSMARGRTSEALDQLRMSQERTRAVGDFELLLGTETLASALARQGDLEGAIRVLELGSKQKRQVAFHWMNNGAYWMRNQLLLARLYRKAGRAADAQKTEADLSNLLAVADADHPILVELRQLAKS